jgi:transposase
MARARHLKCLNIVFTDEVTLQLNPTLSRKWGIRGHQTQVTAWAGNHQKTHIFGAMDPVRGKVYRHFAQTINGLHFVKLLELLLKRYPRKRLVVVADNAIWHKSKILKPFLKLHKRLSIFFLPTRSPDMNPIELLWKLLRQQVTHNHFFGNLRELKKAAGLGLDGINRHPECIQALGQQYVNVH